MHHDTAENRGGTRGGVGRLTCVPIEPVEPIRDKGLGPDFVQSYDVAGGSARPGQAGGTSACARDEDALKTGVRLAGTLSATFPLPLRTKAGAVKGALFFSRTAFDDNSIAEVTVV